MRSLFKSKRKLIIAFGLLVLIPVLVILFISPITKYLIEKYDVHYTGREIKVDQVYVNPFTGYLYLRNFKIYELNSDSIFFTSHGLSISLSLLNLFSKTIEIEKLELDRPFGIALQNKSGYNYQDLVDLFTPDKSADTTKSGFHFNIQKIIINDGRFYYRDPQIPVNYFIKEVNIVSTGIQWDTDTTNVKFSLQSGTGSGRIKGEMGINLKDLRYRFAVLVDKFEMNLIGQYLKDLTNNGVFSAKLDANIKSSGSFIDQEDVTATGTLQINDFHFGKTLTEDFVSFDRLELGINELSPKQHKYLFDSVILSRPYIKYEMYDSLDNIQNMFGKNGSMITEAGSANAKYNLIIEIARYVKILAKNFFDSSYRIRQLSIQNGNLEFNDFSQGEVFSISMSPLSIFADSIDKIHKNVNVDFKSGIIPYGQAEVSLNIDPNDSATFNLRYKLEKFPASLFNPYTIAYTSFPLDRGTIEINGIWNVQNGIIESKNHLVILDPRVTKKLSRDDTKWKPLTWIMSFIRERTNVIDYEIPITGNLKDPKFHLNDIILDVIANVFIKPATTLYRAELKNIETEIEKFYAIKWDMNSSELTATKEKFLNRIAEYLHDNPTATIVISPQIYQTKEEEYILLYKAKMKYLIAGQFINPGPLNEEDVETIEKFSVKDPQFINYLNSKVKDTMVFTTQEKCLRIVGRDEINAQMKILNRERQNVFINYFKGNNTEKQVSFSKEENVTPYNGFSFYKIRYIGEIPNTVKKAYKRLNELDNESPRNKFKEDRNIGSR